MKTVHLRNLEIGTKMPKVCVPIVGKTFSEIIEQAEKISPMGADLVEWRVDYCDFYHDREQVEEVLVSIRQILEDTPILFTFRSKAEGGNADINGMEYLELNRFAIQEGMADIIDVELSCEEVILDEIIRTAHRAGNADINGMEYLELNRFAIQEGMADIIDVELSCEEVILDEIIRTAHRAKIPVMLSSHDFEKTLNTVVMIKRLKYMEEKGADIAKLAVMPKNERDVLNLLDATLTAREQMDIPIVTMAMGGIGTISRLSGECFGSALTFGCVGKASAPGQMELRQLKETLDFIHRGTVRTEME